MIQMRKLSELFKRRKAIKLVIAGLGNPGKKYLKNRHNAGFLAADYLAAEWGVTFNGKKFSAETAVYKGISGEILLLKPQTYMNRSGDPISAALNFYKVDPDSLIVLHDEIEFPFAKTALKTGGGHKGHNGLRSIIQRTGSSDFYRIRIGVGRPEDDRIPVADYVLSDFTGEENKRLSQVFSNVSGLVNELINKLTKD